MKRDAPRQTRLRLDTPVTYLKGVGPARAEALKRLGVVSAVDLLYHIPHRYEDALVLTAQLRRELADEGGLPRAVHSRHEDHGRWRRGEPELGIAVARTEGLGDPLLQCAEEFVLRLHEATRREALDVLDEP